MFWPEIKNKFEKTIINKLDLVNKWSSPLRPRMKITLALEVRVKCLFLCKTLQETLLGQKKNSLMRIKYLKIWIS